MERTCGTDFVETIEPARLHGGRPAGGAEGGRLVFALLEAEVAGVDQHGHLGCAGHGGVVRLDLEVVAGQ